MLKPIRRVPCTPALLACQRLMQQLVAWLCSVNGSVDLTHVKCAPPQVSSQLEGEWLWGFLQKIDSNRTLLSRAQTIANLPPADKQNLLEWVRTVAALTQQFQPAPVSPWPTSPPITGAAWKDFQTLLQAFYKKAFKSKDGLPYLTDGTPTPNDGVTYQQFVSEFRIAHSINPHQDSREVCVLCGGELGKPQVDHWVAEGSYPLLAICSINLLPVCGYCNSGDNKGQAPVYSNQSFDDWFHPYLRHTNGGIRLSYNPVKHTISSEATSPDDAKKVANIDNLLNLSVRWTREFKAEYLKQKKVLIEREKRRIRQGLPRHTSAEILAHLQQVNIDLVATEPHYEVHSTLLAALLVPARLTAWQTELGMV